MIPQIQNSEKKCLGRALAVIALMKVGEELNLGLVKVKKISSSPVRFEVIPNYGTFEEVVNSYYKAK